MEELWIFKTFLQNKYCTNIEVKLYYMKCIKFYDIKKMLLNKTYFKILLNKIALY